MCQGVFPPSFNPCDCPRSELGTYHHHHFHHHGQHQAPHVLDFDPPPPLAAEALLRRSVMKMYDYLTHYDRDKLHPPLPSHVAHYNNHVKHDMDISDIAHHDPHHHDNANDSPTSSTHDPKKIKPHVLLFKDTMMDYVKNKGQVMKNYCMTLNHGDLHDSAAARVQQHDHNNNIIFHNNAAHNTEGNVNSHICGEHVESGPMMCEDPININPHIVHAFFFDST